MLSKLLATVDDCANSTSSIPLNSSDFQTGHMTKEMSGGCHNHRSLVQYISRPVTIGNHCKFKIHSNKRSSSFCGLRVLHVFIMHHCSSKYQWEHHHVPAVKVGVGLPKQTMAALAPL